MTQPNHTHFPLEACSGDRPQTHEDASIQRALAVLSGAGITFEVLTFDQAA